MQFHQEQQALGSIAQISLITLDQPLAVKSMFDYLWKQIFMFELQFSRFLPQSELSTFNRNAGSKQQISPQFKRLLKAAQDIGLAVDGLYNPFILPALQAVGYGPSIVKGHETDSYDDHSTRKVVALDNLIIGEDWAKIPKDTAIDLGGCGKGYLADQLADQIKHKVSGYWISLGGDVVFGGENDLHQAWRIGIQKAKSESSSTDIGWAELETQERYALATSGTTARYGVAQGKLWHHLIDPRTLQPSQTDVLTATVAAPSALKADVLASCAVILGSEQAIPFLKHQKITSALLQCRSIGRGDYNVSYGNIIHIDESA